MKKTINAHRISFLSILTFLGVFIISSMITQKANAMITSELDLGDKNGEVTELQVYLATNASIYPSGLVTGYFGPLTQAAVQRFQIAQGIVSSGSPTTNGFGRVGPQTMARINALLGSVVISDTSWDAVPILSNPLVQVSNVGATLSWMTNEPTQGQVYYDTVSLRSDEATGPLQQPYVSGAYALSNNGLQTNHSIILQNLQPNTLYYYLTRGIDSAGNVTMTWPNTFRTNP